MRSYDVGTVAAALRRSTKWVDNVLSRHAMPGVVRARQGVSREVSFDGLVHLALVNALVSEMAVPVERAVRLAVSLCATGGQARQGPWCHVRVDIERLRGDLALALRDAVETAIQPRRGRPPSRRAHGESEA